MLLNKNRSDSRKELEKMYEEEYRLPWVKNIDGWSMHRYENFLGWLFMTTEETNQKLKEAIEYNNHLKRCGIVEN